jgi:hypothetical protein
LRSSLRRCLLALLAPCVTACEIEKVSIPRTEPRLALHGVLSATASTQVVLLERTRAGLVQLTAPPFDLGSPVVSDEGIPESGALVTLTTPGGHTLLAVEDYLIRDDRQGHGFYRFPLLGFNLERGGTYRLSVRTAKGDLLTAETVVPFGVAADAAVPRPFDRVRDTLLLEWPAARGARSYLVRVETPFGPRTFFTDSTRVRLGGDLRNVDLDELPRVFIPGFPQAVTVSAVDSNFYDWFRSHNDALSGTGLVNRVRGGLGVFGSLVRLQFHELRVVAPQAEPSAGAFVFDGPPAQQLSASYLRLELYVESRAGRADQADALSGRYELRPGFFQLGSGPVNGVLGTSRNGRVELALLRTWSATDTAEVFTGELRGDTLVGSYRGLGGVVRFVRRR